MEDAIRPEVPHCPRCGVRDAQRAGQEKGKQRYRCKECGRYYNGPLAPLPPPPPRPCPHCGAQCARWGRTRHGRQRYRCKACGQTNVNLYPKTAPAPGGPFPYEVMLCLDPAASGCLMRYCQAAKMSNVQAVRDIFRRAAASPVSLVATGRREYDDQGRMRVVITRARPQATTPTLAAEPLPDTRAAARERIRKAEGRKDVPSVYVVEHVKVRLDALAKHGLLLTARSRGITHQEAARYLIKNTPPP